jgi:hypothetical protein
LKDKFVLILAKGVGGIKWFCKKKCPSKTCKQGILGFLKLENLEILLLLIF